MRNTGAYRGLTALTLSVFLLSTASIYAADTRNFSGSYVPERSSKKKDGADPTLKVIQTEDEIEITRIKSRKPLTYRYSLHGVPADYVGPDGEKGKSRAYIKDGNLIIEDLWYAPASGGKFILHSTEKWDLSGDGTLLTIRTDLDCPGNFCNSAPRIEKLRKSE